MPVDMYVRAVGPSARTESDSPSCGTAGIGCSSTGVAVALRLLRYRDERPGLRLPPELLHQGRGRAVVSDVCVERQSQQDLTVVYCRGQGKGREGKTK